MTVTLNLDVILLDAIMGTETNFHPQCSSNVDGEPSFALGIRGVHRPLQATALQAIETDGPKRKNPSPISLAKG